MNAFLLLQAIETVALRIERHVENGGNVPRFLAQSQPGCFYARARKLHLDFAHEAKLAA